MMLGLCCPEDGEPGSYATEKAASQGMTLRVPMGSSLLFLVFFWHVSDPGA